MKVYDKADNTFRVDFTEIVRFEVEDESVYSQSDVNEDGAINILDLIIVAQAVETQDVKADVNGDGTINILDLVEVASRIGEENIAAPAADNLTDDQIQSWIIQAMQADDGSPAFHRGIHVLQSLLLTMHLFDFIF